MSTLTTNSIINAIQGIGNTTNTISSSPTVFSYYAAPPSGSNIPAGGTSFYSSAPFTAPKSGYGFITFQCNIKSNASNQNTTLSVIFNIKIGSTTIGTATLVNPVYTNSGANHQDVISLFARTPSLTAGTVYTIQPVLTPSDTNVTFTLYEIAYILNMPQNYSEF